MPEIEAAPERSGGLTTMIMILAVFQIMGIIVLTVTWINLAAHGRSGQEIAALDIALIILTLIGLGGIWSLRRWGAYLVGVLLTIGLATDALFGFPPILLIIRVGIFSVLGVLIGRQWESFR
ncbi:MAG TPA: hypothetical protein VFO16_18955 [Pseudonocardiaceae bacterium]|nr:hypothetical protein [Pseudonocardiaceae bacterium]